MKKALVIISIIAAILIFIILLSNKTFFKTTYVGINDQEIFIPRYSFFKREAGMTVASFYSLKSEETLEREIENYMKDFKYFEDESTYGYRKGNLFIMERASWVSVLCKEQPMMTSTFWRAIWAKYS